MITRRKLAIVIVGLVDQSKDFAEVFNCTNFVRNKIVGIVSRKRERESVAVSEWCLLSLVSACQMRSKMNASVQDNGPCTTWLLLASLATWQSATPKQLLYATPISPLCKREIQCSTTTWLLLASRATLLASSPQHLLHTCYTTAPTSLNALR